MSQNGLAIWKRSDGSTIKWGDPEVIACSNWSAGKKKKELSLESFIKENANNAGIYAVRLGWKKGGGHFTIVEIDKAGNMIYYDPQNGSKDWIKKWKDKVTLSNRWMMRVDDKLIGTEYSGAFKKAQ